MTIYASKEDMTYYETECTGHKGITALAKDWVTGFLVAYCEPSFVSAAPIEAK